MIAQQYSPEDNKNLELSVAYGLETVINVNVTELNCIVQSDAIFQIQYDMQYKIGLHSQYVCTYLIIFDLYLFSWFVL